MIINKHNLFNSKRAQIDMVTLKRRMHANFQRHAAYSQGGVYSKGAHIVKVLSYSQGALVLAVFVQDGVPALVLTQPFPAHLEHFSKCKIVTIPILLNSKCFDMLVLHNEYG